MPNLGTMDDMNKRILWQVKVAHVHVFTMTSMHGLWSLQNARGLEETGGERSEAPCGYLADRGPFQPHGAN